MKIKLQPTPEGTYVSSRHRIATVMIEFLNTEGEPIGYLSGDDLQRALSKQGYTILDEGPPPMEKTISEKTLKATEILEQIGFKTGYKVLFLTTAHGYESLDPYATLVRLSRPIPKETMKQLECRQVGVGRRDGSWKELCTDAERFLNITHEVLWQGRKSEFDPTRHPVYDEYLMISGNY